MREKSERTALDSDAGEEEKVQRKGNGIIKVLHWKNG